MNKLWAPFFLLLVAAGSLACGGGRRLQSITISQTTNGQQVQFVATGNYSAPPMTLSPLPVMWGQQLYAPPPGALDYTLTSQPYVFSCADGGSQAGPVSAIAPRDPGAPASGSVAFSRMTLAYATINCP